ncbi:EMC6-like membrane protein [Haloferax profundi]|uniref:Uncharacterized protein n=1 Tax=Haloferax profundi TaxID=1544718 RepID=A0A0W1SU47_9EURY|nr:hypothetical protein [Haloferax profundi]KTG29740.1 hypothetical protein AUR66_09345 [Haloferax profundi]
MATETQTELSGHLRGVTVTTLACLAGIAAAVLSGVVVGTTVEAATNQLAVGILGAFILVQLPVLRAVGIDISGAKDYLYVVFMTFALWFISFAILLTSGVQL